MNSAFRTPRSRVPHRAPRATGEEAGADADAAQTGLAAEAR